MTSSAKLSPKEAASILIQDTPTAIEALNTFSQTAFRTRGGRLGSGMGSLLEALWVYFVNRALSNEGGEARQCEIAWLEDHEPNDFACVHRDADWIPGTRHGELFRVEAKSMNVSVDESKGHFTELQKSIGENDQLLVLMWKWEPVDEWRVYPKVIDFILCPAKPIAAVRDALHVARGGSFVAVGACPDDCSGDSCLHVGEPLNAAGIRERLSGPVSTRGANVSYANNFGGLVRMLKTQNAIAREELREIRKSDEVAHRFISFIHRNFPAEEANQYTAAEWQAVAKRANVPLVQRKEDLIESIRATVPNYRELLRTL